MGGESLGCSREQRAGAVWFLDSVVQEMRVVDPNGGGLGTKFLDHGLEEIVGFLCILSVTFHNRHAWGVCERTSCLPVLI